MYVFKPAQKEQEYRAFSNWLNSFVKDSETEALSKEIFELAHLDGDFEEVIEKASGIVSEHVDHFDFPFEPGKDQDVQELLISGWNDSQQADQMSSAILVEGTKVHTVLPNYGLTLSQGNINTDMPSFARAYSQASHSATTSPSYLINPFESGIAIGAP